MKKIISFAIVAALLVIGAGLSQESGENKPVADKHKDRGVTCGVCHNGEADPKSAASPKSCLSCKNHDSWNAVAKLTNNDKGFKFNPHHNHITESNDLDCTQCHQAHKADTIICYNCHQGMKFK
ncbi:MAG: cytochrome c3 family protein [Acidobacteriota bacterium]|nr:cytochrome c3 family protein [Acidobacteriota bacterium]